MLATASGLLASHLAAPGRSTALASPVIVPPSAASAFAERAARFAARFEATYLVTTDTTGRDRPVRQLERFVQLSPTAFAELGRPRAATARTAGSELIANEGESIFPGTTRGFFNCSRPSSGGWTCSALFTGGGMAESMFVGNYLPTLLNGDVATLAQLVNSHQTGYPGDAGAFRPVARTTDLVDGHRLMACLQFGPLRSPAAVECAAPDGRLVFLSTSGGLNNGWIGQALQVSFDRDVAPSELTLPGPVLPAPLYSPPAGEAVSLLAPHALAVGPIGTLYVVDPERDEVLADDGLGFRIVAGDGRRGFGGDGGQALDADLRLDDDSGIAVSENGTLYVADSGNDRVRAVSPNGTIETVLGNGAASSAQAAGRLGFSPTAARSFALGPPQGLALALNGDLVVAASAVVRLSPNGIVSWVAGGTHSWSDRASVIGEPEFDASSGVAVDSEGDVFVVNPFSFGVAEVRARGIVVPLGRSFGFGEPDQAAITNGPHGSVLLAGLSGLFGFSDTGASRRLPAELRVKGSFGFVPEGVALASTGTIYVDTDPDPQWTNSAALLAVSPAGAVHLLWSRSPSAATPRLYAVDTLRAVPGDVVEPVSVVGHPRNETVSYVETSASAAIRLLRRVGPGAIWWSRKVGTGCPRTLTVAESGSGPGALALIRCDRSPIVVVVWTGGATLTAPNLMQGGVGIPPRPTTYRGDAAVFFDTEGGAPIGGFLASPSRGAFDLRALGVVRTRPASTTR
ncbi:MAG TPA: hypothetical protein VMD59_02405 [Acidimicrobiales bacterium]|nr:hypothetical protein [Acidimicrobiales bacterium]